MIPIKTSINNQKAECYQIQIVYPKWLKCGDLARVIKKKKYSLNHLNKDIIEGLGFLRHASQHSREVKSETRIEIKVIHL